MPDFPYATHLDIKYAPLEVVDIPAVVDAVRDKWFNQTLCQVNDSVVRLGVVEGDYHWHKHDDLDEFFYVVEGKFLIDLENRTVELTENMIRAIAKQAEAERDRRAKIIHAEAEFQASQTLVNAAKILSSIPAAMQLRYLQTLAEIGAEQNSTVVFPMPIDIIKPFLELIEKPGKASVTNGATLVPLGSDVPGRVMENHT